MTTAIRTASSPAGGTQHRDAEPSAPGAATGIDPTRRVAKLRRPSQWIITAVAVLLLLNFGQTLFTNPSWEWNRVGFWLFSPAVLTGIGVTLAATGLSAVVSFLGGIVVALGRLSNNPVLSFLSWAYVWLFRSLPLILILVFLYNFGSLYPSLGIGVPFGPQVQVRTVSVLSDLTLGVIGLSLSEIAYSSEVVRSGILAVDQGQHEAAKALGISRFRQFSRIVLPQALRSIVPSYVNQIIGLVKSSSLLFYVSILDVFGVAQNLGSTYPSDIIPLLVVDSLWYLAFTSLISIVQYYVERYYARGSVRVLPPTPFQRVRVAFASITGGTR
jgi:polar amino acid transport system permease protein